MFQIVSSSDIAGAAEVPSSTILTVDIAHSVASLDFLPADLNGAFATSSDNSLVRFSVTTNNSTGYTLTLAGKNNTKQLITINNNAAMDSIIAAEGIDAATFDTETYNNKWGYIPSKYNSEDNTTPTTRKYYESPTTTDVATLDVTNSANITNTSNEYSIGLGARVNYEQLAGSYSNTFVLVAVGNPVYYTINYLDNTNDPTVTNLPSIQTGSTDSTSAIIVPDKTPERVGYTFNKWCLGSVNITGNVGTLCDGTLYGPNSLVTFIDQVDPTNANTLNLYAVWTPNTYTIDLDANGGTLSPSGTTTLVTYGTVVLKNFYGPTREDVVVGTRVISGFTLGTNADGASINFQSGSSCANASNCKSTSVTSYRLNGWYKDAATTDLIATATTPPALQPSTVYTDEIARWNYIPNGTITLYAGWTSSTTDYNNIALPTITKIGHVCGWSTSATDTDYIYSSGEVLTPDENITLYGICVPNSYDITIKTNAGVSSVSLNGTSCTDSTDGCVVNLTYGRTYALVATLATDYRFTKWRQSQSVGSIDNITAANTTFTVGDGNVVIIPEAKKIVPYLQNWAKCSELDVGETTMLVDKRDDEQYVVGKLADNNCWLLDNLRLNLTTVDLATLKGNTNATDESLTYLKNGGGTKPYPANGVVAYTLDYVAGDFYNEPRIATSGRATGTTTWTSDEIVSTNYGVGSGIRGIFYNYCAASAGSYCYAQKEGITGHVLSEDICPTGWKIPGGDTTIGSYYYLHNTGYGANANSTKSALSLLISGYFASRYLQGLNDTSGYWSDYAPSTGGAYYMLLSLNSPYFNPRVSVLRTRSVSVRCILK